ncbi:MAG: hypothetical protein ACLT98_09110 [Eggerthellaceae bacterium]
MGYDIESIYVSGGTPTVEIDELCETPGSGRDTSDIKEVASETNPNHLAHPHLEKMQGRIQRLRWAQASTTSCSQITLREIRQRREIMEPSPRPSRISSRSTG